MQQNAHGVAGGSTPFELDDATRASLVKMQNDIRAEAESELLRKRRCRRSGKRPRLDEPKLARLKGRALLAMRLTGPAQSTEEDHALRAEWRAFGSKRGMTTVEPENAPGTKPHVKDAVNSADQIILKSRLNFQASEPHGMAHANQNCSNLVPILGSIAIAQAQEYQNQSTVYGPGYRQTTYEDGSTKTTTWHTNHTTGEITNVEISYTHAAPVATPTPVRVFVPYTSFNHDGKAFDHLPKSTPVPVDHTPVTVITGKMTPEQVKALMGN